MGYKYSAIQNANIRTLYYDISIIPCAQLNLYIYIYILMLNYACCT